MRFKKIGLIGFGKALQLCDTITCEASQEAVSWSMSTILTAVLPHEEMLLDSCLTFSFSFLALS